VAVGRQDCTASGSAARRPDVATRGPGARAPARTRRFTGPSGQLWLDHLVEVRGLVRTAFPPRLDAKVPKKPVSGLARAHRAVHDQIKIESRRSLRDRAEEFDPVSVRIPGVDEIFVLFSDPGGDRELPTSELSLPGFNIGDSEADVVEFGALPEGLKEPAPPWVEVQFQALGGTGIAEMDPLAPMLHLAPLVNSKSELPVEPKRPGKVASPQPGVNEFDLDPRHPSPERLHRA
jgi:hypothetical protein